jgi:hypothetical protein
MKTKQQGSIIRNKKNYIYSARRRGSLQNQAEDYPSDRIFAGSIQV